MEFEGHDWRSAGKPDMFNWRMTWGPGVTYVVSRLVIPEFDEWRDYRTSA
jgi:hypothetical protein